MSLIRLLLFASLLSFALFTDQRGTIDPDGVSAQDSGYGIDPNGATLDAGSSMDPNGKGAGVDPNGSRSCYSACVDPNG